MRGTGKRKPDRRHWRGVGMRVLGLRGASPVDGGLLLMMDGKIVGGIRVSGVNSEQDAMVAKAGAAGFNREHVSEVFTGAFECIAWRLDSVTNPLIQFAKS